MNNDMNIDDILAILRKPEHCYQGDGLPGETINLSDYIVLELDHDQDKLYTAILKTIPKDSLAQMAKELHRKRAQGEKIAASLVEKIEWMSGEHPRKEKAKNAPITTLLNLFLDKKSKQVRFARKCLRDRFDNQSYRDQNRILRVFLEGPAMDCDWAGRILRENWRKELKEDIEKSWTRTRRPMLAYVILRHFPNRYILQEQFHLSESAGYQYVCARVGNEPEFVLDESRLCVQDYFYVMAKLGRKVDAEAMEKKIYNFLLNYDGYYDHCLSSPSFSNIKGWDRMVWAMGVLGMQDALIRLLQFENKVKQAQPSGSCEYDERWLYFVTAIRNEIDPADVPDRLDREIHTLKSKYHIPESYVNPDRTTDVEKNEEEELNQKAWYFKEERSKNPFMTLKEEWTLFVDYFYYDRPCMHALLKESILTEKDNYNYLSIEIPVHSSMQEKWLNEDRLGELKSLFEEMCSYPATDYDIKLVYGDNYESIDYGIFKTGVGY